MRSPTDVLSRNEQRSEEHTSELQSPCNLVCRLLLEKKKSILNSISHMLKSSVDSHDLGGDTFEHFLTTPYCIGNVHVLGFLRNYVLDLIADCDVRH